MALSWVPWLTPGLEHSGTGSRNCPYLQCCQVDLAQECPRAGVLLAVPEPRPACSTCGGLHVRLAAAPAHGRQELGHLPQREGVVQGLQGIDGGNHGTAFKTWKETKQKMNRGNSRENPCRSSHG